MADNLTGRSKSWLQRHTCAWCGQTLWRALRDGCGAIYEQCDPTKKDFSPAGKRRPMNVPIPMPPKIMV